MSNLLKISGILLALMFSLAGISGDHHAGLLTSVQAAADNDQLTVHLTEKGLNDALCLQQQSELLVSPINSLPAPGSKINPDSFLRGSFSAELRMQSIATQYLVRAGKIYPSLRVGVIIFPFHYFL